MVENFVKVSVHAADRMLERFGYERTDVKQNIAERAWKNGKTYRDYSGKVSRYLYDIENRYSSNEYTVKTYGGKLFIFSKTGVLCTAYSECELFKRLKSQLPIYRENTSYTDYENGGFYAA